MAHIETQSSWVRTNGQVSVGAQRKWFLTHHHPEVSATELNGVPAVTFTVGKERLVLSQPEVLGLVAEGTLDLLPNDTKILALQKEEEAGPTAKAIEAAQLLVLRNGETGLTAILGRDVSGRVAPTPVTVTHKLPGPTIDRSGSSVDPYPEEHV